MSLARYAALRVAQIVPLLLAVAVLSFSLIHLAPGDPLTMLAGDFPLPPATQAQLRAEFGLDRPLHVQLGLYLWDVIRGDLGYSYFNRLPVALLVFERLASTVLLMAFSVSLASLLGVGLGLLAARRRGSWWDSLAMGIGVTGYAVPEFWLGQILVLVFSVRLGWLPAQGMRSLRVEYSGLQAAVDVLLHLVLPAVALSFRYVSLIARITRSATIEALEMEFVLAARARGVSERRALVRHAFRNAIIPVTTVIGYNFGFIVAGSALVETVFGWPGIGRLLYDSILTRDYPVLTGVLIFVSFTVAIVNLLTDLAYAFLDPRIRY